MCGIAGFFKHRDGVADRALLERMTRTLDHRGPDNHAVLAQGPFGLGHARLSIIDVSTAAHQPMLSADGRFGLVYNGEIYNYRELRKELETLGSVFRTHSDTEVLLEAFRRWDVQCFSRLNGMFAAAFADFEKGELTLVRDRFGIKPLNYVVHGGAIFFGSEVKAVLAGLSQVPAVDSLKLVELLTYQELAKGTFFRGINTLEPGAYLRVRVGANEIAEQQWFVPEDLVDHETMQRFAGMSHAGRLDVADQFLRAAVARHLISDVPVGTLCSGGVDSSLLTALCKELNPAVSVYHVDVEGMSERRWADAVARHLNIDMHYVALNEQTFLDNYVDCIYFNDFPLTHPNGIGVFLVSELARRNGCKVLLTGEGADETFGGYDWRYRFRLRYDTWTKLLKWPIKAGSYLTQQATGVWLRRFDTRFNFKARAPIADVLSFCTDQHFRRDRWQKSWDRLPDTMSRGERNIQASLLSDLRDYISGILHRQDRASMQASIESRVPFLDHTLVQVAVNMPLREKVRWNADKPLLKELAARYLPRDIVYREKVGFGLRSDAYSRKIDRAVFRGGFVEQSLGIASEQILRLIDSDFQAFGQPLLGLEFWGRMFVLGESRHELRGRFIPGRAGSPAVRQ